LEDDTAQFDPLLGTLAQRRGLRAYLHGLPLPGDRNTTMTTSAGAEPVVGAQPAAVQGLQRSGRQPRMCLTRVSRLSALAVQSVAEAPTEVQRRTGQPRHRTGGRHLPGAASAWAVEP
jgi:hypothetical protein